MNDTIFARFATAAQQPAPIPAADLNEIREETHVLPSIAGLPRIIRAFIPAVERR